MKHKTNAQFLKERKQRADILSIYRACLDTDTQDAYNALYVKIYESFINFEINYEEFRKETFELIQTGYKETDKRFASKSTLEVSKDDLVALINVSKDLVDFEDYVKRAIDETVSSESKIDKKVSTPNYKNNLQNDEQFVTSTGNTILRSNSSIIKSNDFVSYEDKENIAIKPLSEILEPIELNLNNKDDLDGEIQDLDDKVILDEKVDPNYENISEDSVNDEYKELSTNERSIFVNSSKDTKDYLDKVSYAYYKELQNNTRSIFVNSSLDHDEDNSEDDLVSTSTLIVDRENLNENTPLFVTSSKLDNTEDKIEEDTSSLFVKENNNFNTSNNLDNSNESEESINAQNSYADVATFKEDNNDDIKSEPLNTKISNRDERDINNLFDNAEDKDKYSDALSATYDNKDILNEEDIVVTTISASKEFVFNKDEKELAVEEDEDKVEIKKNITIDTSLKTKSPESKSLLSEEGLNQGYNSGDQETAISYDGVVVLSNKFEGKN